MTQDDASHFDGCFHVSPIETVETQHEAAETVVRHPTHPAILPYELDEIESLLFGLKKGEKIRTLGGAFIDALRKRKSETVPLDREFLLTTLAHPAATRWKARWKARKAAAWMLGAAGTGEDWIPFDLNILRGVLEGRQQAMDSRFSRALVRTVVTAFALAFLPIVTLLLRDPPSVDTFLWFLGGTLITTSVLSLLLGIIILPLSLTNDKMREDEVRGECALALARISGKDSIDALSRVLKGGMAMSDPAVRGLKAVLPLLTFEDYGQLPADVVPNLCAALLRHGNQGFVARILHALEKVGDGRAVRPVEQFANGGDWPKLRETANRILPILRERQRKENDQQMLLRGSSPVGSGEHLLRAAGAETPTLPALLLRASETLPASNWDNPV